MATYSILKLKRSDFSRRLLITKEFIQELYVHMGFQAPTSYKNVIELIINDGIVILTNNIPGKMEYRKIPDLNRDDEPENIQKWIAEKFSLDY